MQPDYILVRDYAELKEFKTTFNAQHDRESSLWTIICKIWRDCTELGMLEFPIPHKRILTMEECFCLLKDIHSSIGQ